jgi:hypothetical protein
VRACRSHPALALLVLCCSAACGPAQTVDRTPVVVDAARLDSRDATGGTGGAGGVGGGGGMGGGGGSGGTGGLGGGGGSGGSDGSPDPDAPVPDASDSAPDPDGASPDGPPPADTAPDAPIQPLVSVSHAPAVASTDLTEQGNYDWRHWGYNSASASNRRRFGPAVIGMSAIGATSFGRYNDRPVRFSWSNGTPTTSVASTADGIVVGDEAGRGYEIRVAGSPTRTRMVRVYLGVWGARARLTASLSDESGARYTDTTLTAQNPGADRIYTIVFQPETESQTLVLRWTVDQINQRYGNVTLQAVTVSE